MTQILEWDRPNVPPIDKNRAFVCFVQPQNQFQRRALGRAVLPDDDAELARLNRERHVLNDVFCRSWVFE